MSRKSDLEKRSGQFLRKAGAFLQKSDEQKQIGDRIELLGDQVELIFERATETVFQTANAEAANQALYQISNRRDLSARLFQSVTTYLGRMNGTVVSFRRSDIEELTMAANEAFLDLLNATEKLYSIVGRLGHNPHVGMDLDAVPNQQDFGAAAASSFAPLSRLIEKIAKVEEIAKTLPEDRGGPPLSERIEGHPLKIFAFEFSEIWCEVSSFVSSELIEAFRIVLCAFVEAVQIEINGPMNTEIQVSDKLIFDCRKHIQRLSEGHPSK